MSCADPGPLDGTVVGVLVSVAAVAVPLVSALVVLGWLAASWGSQTFSRPRGRS
jgi:hypothetical protein